MREVKMIDFSKNKKTIAFIIPLILLAFIIYASLPFISAFFGTIILFVIFRPLNNFLVRRYKINKVLAAGIIIILSLIIIVLPLILLIQGLIDQIYILPEQINKLENIEETINQKTPFNIDINKKTIINQIIPFISTSLSSVLSNALRVLANLFLMYFLLFYLLVNSDSIIRIFKNKLPYTEENSQFIIRRFSEITKATLIGTFFIGLIQGTLLAISFYIVGIPNALFWGVIGTILSFIPVIGSPLIWIPATVILFLSGAAGKALVVLIFGIILSNIDNIIRPILNKKFGKIHPVVSIIGLYIGITQFGFVGIFIGPLIVAYSIILWKIYKEEIE